MLPDSTKMVRLAMLLAIAAAPVSTWGRLLLENGYTQAGCKGDAIPSTISHTGVCGPMTTTFSGLFTANDTDVVVQVYNGTQCTGPVYERRDVGIGACSAGTWAYTLAPAAPVGTCVAWGYTSPSCLSGTSISGTIARRNARCVPALGYVNQGFASDAGDGKFNLTVMQYDAHFKDCAALSSFDLLQVGQCSAVAGWFAPYVRLECY